MQWHMPMAYADDILSWHQFMTYMMTYTLMTYVNDISFEQKGICHCFWPYMSPRCRIKTICHCICHWGGVSSMHVITCVIAYVISCYGVLRVALMTHDDYIYQWHINSWYVIKNTLDDIYGDMSLLYVIKYFLYRWYMQVSVL